MSKTITIDYSPHDGQRDIHDSSSRFRVIVCGRRFGKTTCAVNELIRTALTTPDSRCWYVAPSYRQAKMIAFEMIKQYLPKELILKINQVELTFFLKNGAIIALKGADTEDTLRGVSLNIVVLDEFASMKSNVWMEIIRPMLIDSGGKAIFIGTPRGCNHFYDLYQRGLDEEDSDWKSWHYPTSANKYIPAEEIYEAKKDLSEMLFKQEFLAEFLDDETSVFKGIKKCAISVLREPEKGKFYVMGADLAKHQDFTVLTVMEASTREVVAFDRFQDISWTEQKVRIQALASRYNNALVLLDSTGVGDPILDDLQVSFVSAEGYKFNNESKKRLINFLAVAIEQRLITFPDIEVLVNELQIYEYAITSHGAITYNAPSGKHDDCVISLALAVWACKTYIQSAQLIERRLDEEKPEFQDRQGMGEPLNRATKSNWGY